MGLAVALRLMALKLQGELDPLGKVKTMSSQKKKKKTHRPFCPPVRRDRSGSHQRGDPSVTVRLSVWHPRRRSGSGVGLYRQKPLWRIPQCKLHVANTEQAQTQQKTQLTPNPFRHNDLKGRQLQVQQEQAKSNKISWSL